MLGQTNPPCLFIVFNRPRKVEQTIKFLVQAQPSRVYVHGDGPRSANREDVDNVAEVWRIVEGTEWPCEVITRRSERNLGLGNGVASAVTWFFQHETSGMIIEDDVAIESSSLPLAGQMLEYGRERKEIGSISLFNAVPERYISESGATFRSSIYVSSLYWGTWADRWSELDWSFDDWEASLSRERLKDLGGSAFERYWTGFFNRLSTTPKDTWDYAWLARNWSLNRRTLFTNRNFMLHLGFDSEGTHSHEAPRWFPNTRAEWMGEFRPPQSLSPDQLADSWSSRNQVGVGARKALKRLVAERLPWSRDLYSRLRSSI